MISGVIAIAGFAMWSLVSPTQISGASSRDALVDVLVWGADLKIDPDAYPSPVKTELKKHLQRSQAYRSQRPRPTSSELQMLYAVQVRYERQLVAVTDDPRARSLAVAYVDGLGPCYEWEGYSDCPEREATFATQYQRAHTGGPFSEFLTLLAAHRWLCTAEAYEYEKEPDGAARSRRQYEQAILRARQSTALLVRTAAEGLTTRGRCWSQH